MTTETPTLIKELRFAAAAFAGSLAGDRFTNAADRLEELTAALEESLNVFPCCEMSEMEANRVKTFEDKVNALLATPRRQGEAV